VCWSRLLCGWGSTGRCEGDEICFQTVVLTRTRTGESLNSTRYRASGIRNVKDELLCRVCLGRRKWSQSNALEGKPLTGKTKDCTYARESSFAARLRPTRPRTASAAGRRTDEKKPILQNERRSHVSGEVLQMIDRMADEGFVGIMGAFSFLFR
jgi:hypothetical protein